MSALAESWDAGLDAGVAPVAVGGNAPELLGALSAEQGDQAAPSRLRCTAPSLTLMWQTWDGRLVPVGCGRNTCPRCAWLKAAENVQVVKLDAQERMPTFGITLTTADPDFPARRFRTAMSQYFRWLRREFPVEYLGLIEWSTGRALTAKGHRYQHQHTLVKGIPTGTDTDPLWRESKRRWEHLTGAYRVEFRELRTPAGAISYMVAHHHKAEQATPEGRSSTRFRPSRGYFDRPVADLRAEARAMRARAVALLELVADYGDALDEMEPGEVEDIIDGRVNMLPATLVRIQRVPETWDDDGEPATWSTEVVGPFERGR